MTFQEINNYFIKFQKISLQEKLFFIQHLRVMVKSGISLSGALNALAKQTDNQRFKQILADIKETIEKGESFSKALRKHNKIFGNLLINMIEAGETSGKLEETLEQIFIQMKKEHEIKSKVKGAMIYPIVVLIAMLLIGIGMLVFIVPRIVEVFKSSKVELPLPTRLLIATSNIIINHGLLVFLAVFLVILLFYYSIKTDRGRYYFDKTLLSSPIAGKIVKKINIARFSRTLSSLLKTDIPITRTLEITSQVLGNSFYRLAAQEAASKVAKGINIATTLEKKENIFPPVVVEIIAIGEETGSLDSVLTEIAEFYEEEIDQTMKNLPSLIEPILILVLGAGVALMALAIIMPMYSLTEAI